MSLYKEWNDFVCYRDPDKIRSEAQRLDVSKAVLGIGTAKATYEQRQQDFDELTRWVLIVHKEDIVGPDDEFEAMEIRQWHSANRYKSSDRAKDALKGR